MKNYIFAALFCFGGSILFASCEKCVTCDWGAGVTEEFCSKDKDLRDAFEQAGEATGANCSVD